MPDRTELLGRVLDGTSDGIVALAAVRGADGAVTDFEWLLVNPAAERILGRRAEDLVGRRLLIELPEIARSDQWRAYVQVVETGVSTAIEHAMERDGLRLWYRDMITATGDGLVVTFQDITDRKEADEQDERAFEEATDLMAMLTADGRFERLNPAWNRVLGYGDADLAGTRFADIVTDEDQRHAARAIERLVPMFEVRVLTASGEPRRLIWSVVRSARRTLLIGRDVTERREAERRLSESEALYRGLLERTGALIVRTGPDGRIQFANSAFAELVGRRAPELVGSTALVDAVGEGDAPDLMDAFQTLAAPPHRVRLACTLMRGDVPVQVALEGVALLSVTGGITGYQWTGIPLGCEDGVLALPLAKPSDAAVTATMLDGAPIAIAVCDSEGLFRTVNQRFAAFLGYSTAELRRMRMQDVSYLGDWDRELAIKHNILHKGGDEYEIQKRFKRKDGQIVLAVAHTRLLPDGAGPPLECCVVRDIGDAVRVQQHLERSRWRVEMIGRFVDGLAYDLKFLRRQHHTSSPDNALLELWDAARFDALLAFLDRRGDPDYARVPPLAFTPVIQDRVTAWQARVQDHIRIVAELSDPTGAAKIMRDDLSELLDHLVGNACFAVDTGGTVRISLEAVELPQLATDRFMHLFPGEYLQVTISDDGSGMPADVAQRAWEPFFSAWPSRATTGVGLTLTRAIARRWEGDVVVESLPGFGTTVTLVVPRYNRAASLVNPQLAPS